MSEERMEIYTRYTDDKDKGCKIEICKVGKEDRLRYSDDEEIVLWYRLEPCSIEENKILEEKHKNAIEQLKDIKWIKSIKPICDLEDLMEELF